MPQRVGFLALIPILSSIFLVLLLSATPSSAASKRIIVIETMPVPVVLEHSRWFMQGMKDLGYLEGENTEFVLIKGQGDRELAKTELKKAVAQKKPDLVVTFATLASQAAWQVLGDGKIPIVFSVVSDPVGAGLINEVGKPTGTNITGRVFSLFKETKLRLLLRLLKQRPDSKVIRFGAVHSSYPSARGDIKALKEIASKTNGVEFIAHEVPYKKMPAGLDEMLANYGKGVKELESKVDYWWQISGPLGELEETTKLLMKISGLPVAYANTVRGVELGALMTVNPSFEEGGKEAARLAHQILQGDDPGTIPVIAPENFDLAINLTTAVKLGIAIPSDMMTMAGSHLYR